MNTKLIVMDIDGTLVDDNTRLPSKKTIDVLRKAHSSGIKLALASGRNVEQIIQMVNKYDFGFEMDLIIGYGGAEIYDGILKKKISYSKLDEDSIKEILETMLAKYPDLNPAIYEENFRICLKMPDEEEFKNHNKNVNNLIAKDLKDFYQNPHEKIMFRIKEERLNEIWPFAKNFTNGRFYAIRTQTTMLEFCHIDSKKSIALTKFCKAHDIDLKDVVSFGDMDNDNDMLEVSGLGVALKNAADSTKEIADDITEFDNNHDGLAIYIEEKILN